MTSIQAELHRAHKARHQIWNDRGVPDLGIDLKRPSRRFMLRDVPISSPGLIHCAPIIPLSIRVECPPPPPAPVVEPDPIVPFAVSARYARLVVRMIITVVAYRYRTNSEEIMGPSRTAVAVRPRFVAMYLARLVTHKSTPWVGRQFGGRDHSTVLNALEKTKRRVLADFDAGSDLAALECVIRNRLV